MKFRLVSLVPLAVLALLAGPAAGATAAPANDNYASGQVLSGALPITVGANNIGATAEAGEPEAFSIPPRSSVWFKWVPASGVDAVLDMCHANFSGGESYDTPVMGIYSGTTLATLVSVADTNGPCSLRFHANAGVTYNFQIDYYDLEGTFDFRLRQLTPPANDNFATSTGIGPALPITTNGTTVDATWQAGEPPALGGSASKSRSVWYSWTAPATQRVRLTLCEKTFVDGALNDSTLVYTGATLATLVPVANTTSNDCKVEFSAVAGATYRIAISGTSPGEFDFVLELEAAPPPDNDDFANARVIGPGLPVNATGDNGFATEEAGEPDHGGYSDTSRSVWYSWTAGESARMRLKACDPDLRFFTSVYTGAALAALTEVGERTYYAPCSVFFDATAGTTYHFAVAGGPFDGTYGPFAVNLHKVALPANDAFEAAINLGAGLKISRKGTTVDATTEENEPGHAPSYGGEGGSVWYRWKAPNTNPVILSACSKGEPNRITVYDEDPESEGTGFQKLRMVDSDDHSCRNGSKGGRLAIAPAKGTSYRIVITPYLEDFESAFTLKVEGIASGKSPFNLKKAIAQCKKLEGKKKQARCIKAAKRKAALLKCQKIKNKKAKAKCIKSAKRRFK